MKHKIPQQQKNLYKMQFRNMNIYKNRPQEKKN